MKKNTIIGFVVCGIACASIGFSLGMSHGKTQALTTMQMGGRGMIGNRGAIGTMRGGGFVSGEIIAKDTTSITVKLRDGSSKILFFTTDTPILKSTAGATGDLSIGQQIMTTGKTNTDGSVTADSIQIRPAMPKIQ